LGDWGISLTSEDVLRRDDFGLAVTYTEPRTATESAVAALWQQAMGVDRIGVHDSFFELGGKSFAAAVIFSEIERRYGVQLPMAVLVELQTVAQLSGKIDELARH
jgi:acyl carrier protein